MEAQISTAATPRRGEIAVMGKEGDTKIIWDKSVPAEVENARENFNRLLEKGFTAFSVGKDHEKSQQIRAFDPDAERLILVPPVVAG